MTAFNLFTFFRAYLIQSEASWKLSSTSDWLMLTVNHSPYFLKLPKRDGASHLIFQPEFLVFPTYMVSTHSHVCRLQTLTNMA